MLKKKKKNRFQPTFSAQQWQWCVFQKSVLERFNQTTVQVHELPKDDLIHGSIHSARRRSLIIWDLNSSPRGVGRSESSGAHVGMWSGATVMTSGEPGSALLPGQSAARRFRSSIPHRGHHGLCYSDISHLPTTCHVYLWRQKDAFMAQCVEKTPRRGLPVDDCWCSLRNIKQWQKKM